MDDFDCTTAGREIAAYVDELSNWYVRLNRRRFWDGDQAALATLRHCLLEVAKLLAPFTPFLADEIHANLDAAPPTRCTSPITRSPIPSSRTASSRPGSRRRCARSSSAAPRGPRPGSRTASPCAVP